jgi:hypothetical protein
MKDREPLQAAAAAEDHGVGAVGEACEARTTCQRVEEEEERVRAVAFD